MSQLYYKKNIDLFDYLINVDQNGNEVVKKKKFGLEMTNGGNLS